MLNFDDIGDQLVEGYDAMGTDAKAKYFNYFHFTDDDPLAPVVPLVGIDKFFGTVVQNILIISKPFGWDGTGSDASYSWPPAGFDDSKSRLIASFGYFARYECLVWMDFSFDPDEDCPDGGGGSDNSFLSKMETTEGDIQQMCTDLAQYGFTYMGRLTGDEDADYFKAYIDPHWSKATDDPDS